MYKKIAITIVALSFFSLSAKPVDSAKKYSFALVQQAEKRIEEKIKNIDLIIHSFDQKLKMFETSLDKEGFLNLSVKDKRKLKFLLHQVIAYK